MKLITYFPAWAEDRANRIQYDLLTNIIYSFAIPTEDGGVFIDNPEFAKELVKKSHENNVKISIAVGGWSWKDIPLEPTFIKATKTDELVEKFANAIVSLCDEYDFDGVDMDWEHPRVTDGSGKRYERLMVTLSEKLHAKGKLLTSAVIGGVDAQGNPGGIDTGGADVGNAAMAQTDTVLKAVDWLNVMAYDGPGDHHSSYDYAKNSVSFWKDYRGMPSQKLVLGVPFYAKGKNGGAYSELLEKFPKEAPTNDVLIIDGERCCYNGIPTLTKKAQLVKDQHLGGMMIWEVSHDTLKKEYSLLSAMAKALKE